MSTTRRLAPAILRLLDFKPPPPVCDWLEKEITIPGSMSPRQPGPFRVGSRPQMRPILEDWHPASGVRDQTIAAGSQWAKTFIGIAGTAYLLHHMPGPLLIGAPSESFIQEEISKKRLRALIDANPILASKKPHNLDEYKILHLSMTGMPIDLCGMNSPTALAGSTRRYIIIEEASKVKQTDHDETPEAHPIFNALERTKDFAGLEFHYMSSTPNSPTHIFWQRMLAGSMTRFALKCPHCREWFPLEWVYPDNRAEFEDEFYGKVPAGYHSVVWDKDARAKNGQWKDDKVRASARFICPKNGCEITENDRQAMMPDFEQHVGNEYAASSKKSYRVPSFYAPRVTFGDLALEFLGRDQNNKGGLQKFTNSWLALPWQQIDASVKDEDVRKLRDISHYGRGEIPSRPFALAMGADVGDNKTEWEVGAIMENGEIFLIDWGTVLNVEDLIPLAEQLKYRISGTDEWIKPAQGLVDSRDQTLRVYAMCQRSRGFWWPSAGSDVNVGHWGVKLIETHGLDRYTFNVFAFKFELYIRAIKKQESPRFYFPRDADEDLIHGHCGQQLATFNGIQKWKKLPNDHYGDCSLRLILARNIFFWRAGRAQAGPDITIEAPKIGTFPE